MVINLCQRLGTEQIKSRQSTPSFSPYLPPSSFPPSLPPSLPTSPRAICVTHVLSDPNKGPYSPSTTLTWEVFESPLMWLESLCMHKSSSSLYIRPFQYGRCLVFVHHMNKINTSPKFHVKTKMSNHYINLRIDICSQKR